MQSNKESSARLLKKCGIRKISTHKHKVEKTLDNQALLSKPKIYRSDKSIKTNSQLLCPYCGSPSTFQLLDRFRQLQKKYSDTLDMIKNRTQLYQSQKKQLERLRACHERDRKEINQLRAMFGFLKRVEAGTQTRQQEIRAEINAEKRNLSIEDEARNVQKRVLRTPARNRKQQSQESYAFYSHNYSSESTKTLPQRKRISKKNIYENQQQIVKYNESYQNLRKSRKKSEEPIIKSPEQNRPLYHNKLSTSSFSRLRFKYSQHM